MLRSISRSFQSPLVRRFCSKPNNALKLAQDYVLFKKSQKIAFQSATLHEPESIATELKEDFGKVLKFSTNIYEMNEFLNKNSIKVKYVDNVKANVPINSPTGTWIEIMYPFETDPHLKGKYEKLTKFELRAGLIMEDMDALAADIGYRYIKDLPNSEQISIVFGV